MGTQRKMILSRSDCCTACLKTSGAADVAEADGTMQGLNERVRAEDQKVRLIAGRKAPCTSF